MIIDFGQMTRFSIIRTLGAGGMGVVYEAFDREHNVRVALKTLTRADADAVERFKREFRTLQDLRHPNLIALGELFEVGDTWFFTMDLIEGVDLAAWVRPGGQLDEARLRSSMAQLATGLGALHAADKVHRDVKPTNVRVDADGHLTLLDFGLVRELGPDAAPSGDLVVGTTAYMAPEQAAGGATGPAADWYAFGVVLYELLAGRVPFAGQPLQVMMDKQRREPPPPSAFAPVPPELDALAVALLHFAPEARPGVNDVLRRLGAVPEIARPSSSGARAAPFIGRGDEMLRLREAWKEVRRGATVAVVVRGESGVGKSTLVRRFSERVVAEVPQLLVLKGRCYERELVAYKALDGAMEGLARHLRTLDATDAALVVGPDAGLVARLFPVLEQVPAVRRAAAHALSVGGAEELRKRAFAALRELFVRLAERQPLMLVVDDLQWADADSLALLEALLGGRHAPALLLLATSRADVAAPVLAKLDLRLLELRGLSTDDARTLATQLADFLGVQVDAADVVRETRGHPMFLHELVRHAATVGTSTGVRLEEALVQRVDALEPPARQLLDVLALAGAPIPLRVASVAAGLAPAEGVRMAALLRTAMLARSATRREDDRLEVYHDRLRLAVALRVGVVEADALHKRIADALEHDGSQDARLLAFHLEASGQGARAAVVAERAAGTAAAALAFDRAADLYATALRLGQHGRAERRRLRELLGDALSTTGRSVEAAEAFLAIVSDETDAAARLEFRRRAAEQLLIAGQIERGLVELRVVFAEAGLSLPSTPGGAIASLLWSRLKLQLRGLRWTPRDRSDLPPRQLQLLELHKSVATGLTHIDYVRGAAFNLRGLLLAMKTGQAEHVANALLLLAPLRAAEGQHRRARVDRLLGEAKRIVEASGDASLKERLLGAHGCCEYVMGNFAVALPMLEAADAALRELGGNVWQANNYRMFTIFGLHYLGRYDQLESHLDRYEREARRGDKWMEASLSRGRNILWIAHDEPERVLPTLDAAWSPPETGFFQLQQWYLLLVRSSLALYTGDLPALDAMRPTFDAVERSPLMRLQITRAEHEFTCARIALVQGRAGEARRRIARLAREAVGHAQARAALLGAMLTGGREALAAAAVVCENAGMPFLGLQARYRLGNRDADAALRTVGVRNPERAVQMMLPPLAKG